MNAVAVFVKHNGILVACRALPAPDGCTWECGVCGLHPLLRASFGVMSGMWRCRCGSELELLVDGLPVAIEEVALNPVEPEEVQQQNVLAQPRRRRKKLTDEEFLRECGIANTEEVKP